VLPLVAGVGGSLVQCLGRCRAHERRFTVYVDRHMIKERLV
jgi:hypothetical protein